MIETKHTPGPWEVSDTSVCLDGPLSSWNRTICDLGHYGSDGRTCYPNAKANGLLIAAAPNMFAALEACPRPMFQTTEQYWKDMSIWFRDVALPAIAKAKGASTSGTCSARRTRNYGRTRGSWKYETFNNA